MLPLVFAWFSAAAFAASLLFFVYAYFHRFAEPAAAQDVTSALALNVALFTVFAGHHSLFARTGIKAFVRSALAPSVERAFYTLVSSILFVLVCVFWRPVPGVVYDLPWPWRAATYAALAAGLLITAISARKLDVLDLAGVRQVADARIGRTRGHTPLATEGLYGFVRHPLYFGWVLMVFGVGTMTATQLSFAVISTAYLMLAVPLEERSLVETFGPDYASYRQRVRWRMIPGVY